MRYSGGLFGSYEELIAMQDEEIYRNITARNEGVKSMYFDGGVLEIYEV
jgi:hypothetical protein